MSQFNCPLVEVQIEAHPNADTLEVAKVGDYQSIVKKGQFKTGDLAVYIPEQAIVPENVLDYLGLKDKLSGPRKDRVKAVKLRGVVSQGLIMALPEKFSHYKVGHDMALELGIIKYDPPVPAELRGSVSAMHDFAFKFDVENYKKFPNVFKEDERVFITEKLHGTFTFYAEVVNAELRELHKENLIEGKYLVGSKGQSAAGLFFKPGVDNVYTRNLSVGVKAALEELRNTYTNNETKLVFVIGESLGVQGGFDYGSVKFRAFGCGMALKTKGRGYLDFKPMRNLLTDNDVDIVPVLYEGLFSKAKMIELSNGRETVSGQERHMREGVVVYAYNEGRDEEIGRRILKYVGDEYLMKSTGEEFN